MKGAQRTKVTAAELARAKRVAYGLAAGPAVQECQRFRTRAGAVFALSIERGFQSRSAVVGALESRIWQLEGGVG